MPSIVVRVLNPAQINLLNARKKDLNYTLAQISDESHVSASTISRMLNGQVSAVTNVDLVMKALHVTQEDLDALDDPDFVPAPLQNCTNTFSCIRLDEQRSILEDQYNRSTIYLKKQIRLFSILAGLFLTLFILALLYGLYFDRLVPHAGLFRSTLQ